MKKNGTQIIVIILLLAGALAGLTSLIRPELILASETVTDFSAERAMEHVEAISQAPHPAAQFVGLQTTGT